MTNKKEFKLKSLFNEEYYKNCYYFHSTIEVGFGFNTDFPLSTIIPIFINGRTKEEVIECLIGAVNDLFNQLEQKRSKK